MSKDTEFDSLASRVERDNRCIHISATDHPDFAVKHAKKQKDYDMDCVLGWIHVSSLLQPIVRLQI